MPRFEDIDWANLLKGVKKCSKRFRWAPVTFRLIDFKRNKYGVGCPIILRSNNCKPNVTAEIEFNPGSLRFNLCWNYVKSLARYLATTKKAVSKSILGNLCRKGWFGRIKTDSKLTSLPTSRFSRRVDSLDLFAWPIGNSLPTIYCFEIVKLSLRSLKKVKFDEECFWNGASFRNSPRISLLGLEFSRNRSRCYPKCPRFDPKCGKSGNYLSELVPIGATGAE